MELKTNMRKRVLLVSDLHYCQRDWYDVPSAERMEHLLAALAAEHRRDPCEMILFLGDYSLDHWQWQEKGTWIEKGKSYTKEFVEEYCGRLPAPHYMIAGNHEQYGNALWREITGFDRQFSVPMGNFVFILLDTYAGDLDPTEHSDGTYTAIDADYLRAEMAKYPDRKFILCSHFFDLANESGEVKELVRDPRVLCFFCGHTHGSNVKTLPADLGGKKVFFTGNYTGLRTPLDCMWGFRDLVLEEGKLTSSYIIPEKVLFFKGATVSFPYMKTDVDTVLF